MYFEHAEEYGPLLNLKVSMRRSRPGLGPVPMVGLGLIEHAFLYLMFLTGRFPVLPA